MGEQSRLDHPIDVYLSGLDMHRHTSQFHIIVIIGCEKSGL